jgi:hypothetical protein
MTKLICPECHKTTFDTASPTQKHVLNHMREVHDLVITPANTRRCRERQDREWQKLADKNDQEFDDATRDRQEHFDTFAADDSAAKGLPEHNVNHLHKIRSWLMDVDDDAADDPNAEPADRDSVRHKQAMDRFGQRGGYAPSLRYHANTETALLARERAGFVVRAAPGNPLGRALQGFGSQEETFEQDFPGLARRQAGAPRVCQPEQSDSLPPGAQSSGGEQKKRAQKNGTKKGTNKGNDATSNDETSDSLTQNGFNGDTSGYHADQEDN